MDYVNFRIDDPEMINFIISSDIVLKEGIKPYIHKTTKGDFNFEDRCKLFNKKVKLRLIRAYEINNPSVTLGYHTIYIGISVHYINNDYMNNASDLTTLQGVSTLKYIFDSLGVKNKEYEYITPIKVERGVNEVVSDYIASNIIDSVLFYRKTPYKLIYDNYKEVEKNKLYLKYNQLLATNRDVQNVDKNTLRFENVYNRVMLKKLGINTLSDLLSVEKQKVLSDDMKETLKYILIIEKAPIKNMYSDEDYKYLMTRKTKKYWTDLIKNDPANFARERKKYDSISLYSKSIKSAIKNKINLTTSEVLVKVELSSKQQENRDINTCDTDICKVTGYKIMHVKKRRCFLGAKCVEYYHKNNKEIFEKLKNAFLVKEKYYNTNIKEQYKDIAHNIRNRHHNKFRYIARAGVNQIPLF